MGFFYGLKKFYHSQRAKYLSFFKKSFEIIYENDFFCFQISLLKVLDEVISGLLMCQGQKEKKTPKIGPVLSVWEWSWRREGTMPRRDGELQVDPNNATAPSRSPVDRKPTVPLSWRIKS